MNLDMDSDVVLDMYVHFEEFIELDFNCVFPVDVDQNVGLSVGAEVGMGASVDGSDYVASCCDVYDCDIYFDMRVGVGCACECQCGCMFAH